MHLNHPGDPCYESGDSPDGANILTCAGGGRQADGGLNTRKLFALVASDDKAGVEAFFADNNLANGDGSAARNIYMPDQYNRRHPTLIGGIIPETGNLVHYAAQIGAPRVMEFLLTVLAANNSKIFDVDYQRTRESDAAANLGETALMWAFTHWQHGFAATIVRQLHEAGADLEIFDNSQSPRMRALDIGITLYVQESGRYNSEDSPQAGPIPPALQGLGQAIIYLNNAEPGNCTTTATQKGPCVLPADLTGESVLAQVVLEKYLVGGSVVASVAGRSAGERRLCRWRRAGHFHRPAGCGRGDNNVDRQLRQRGVFPRPRVPQLACKPPETACAWGRCLPENNLTSPETRSTPSATG